MKPGEFYHQENEIPMGINLGENGYGLVTLQGAKQRGWTEGSRVEPAKVREGVLYTVAKNSTATVQQVSEGLTEKYGEVAAADLDEAVVTLVRESRLYAVRGDQEQKEKPDLIHGAMAALYNPQPGDILVTPAQAAERGWITGRRQSYSLAGREGAVKVLPLLRRLGSIYNKGAKSAIETLDLTDLELPQGGTLRLQLNNVTPASMKLLGELFEVLDGVTENGERTEVYLDIVDPDENCLLIRELKNK